MSLPQSKLLTKEERKNAVLKAQQANEKIFKLVVKIINWQSGSLANNSKNTNKITSDEWQRYRQHLRGIYKLVDEKVAKEKLKETYKAIKDNGGFE